MESPSASTPPAPDPHSECAAPRPLDRREVELETAASAPAPEAAAETPRASRFVFSRTLATTGLFLIALLYTAYFARDFLLPIVLALFLNAVLRPVVRWLKRGLFVPEALGAALVVFGLVAASGYGVYRLAQPAAEWIASAPETLRQLEIKVRSWRKPVEAVGQAAEHAADALDKITSGDGGTPATEVEIKEPSFTDLVVGKTTAFLAQAVTAIMLLYFLLASGDLFMLKLVRILPRFSDKKRAVEIARCVSSEISTYVGTITLINIGFGVSVAIAMSLLDMPNPMLWGILACVTNYVPYLGGLVSTAVIGLVAFQQFPDASKALLPPLAYLALNALESELVTPMILGRRMFLNPVVVFAGVMFWTWIWGIPGAILATPMLVVLKIVSDRVPPLAALGEFLGGRAENGHAVSPQTAPPEVSATVQPSPSRADA